MRKLAAFLSLPFAFAAASVAHANNYTGSLSDDTTGPIPVGTHVMTGGCGIPAGKTLTIAPGAILKFKNGAYLALDGTLVANGTVGQQVVMTSWTDDSAGGDTNGDGVSVGTPGYWYGLLAHAGGAASSIKFTQLRYAGYAGYGGIQFEQSGSDLTLQNSTIRDCSSAGINLNGTASFPSISSCSFLSNGGAAINNARVDSVPFFSNNSATSNGGNYVRVSNGTLSANRTIGPANCGNAALFLDSPLVVPAGLTLTLQAGTVLKFNVGGYTTLDGSLVTTGTAGSPVVFTSVTDDSAGGDTNNDGASVGTSGYWYGIIARTGSAASSLTRVEIRYAGYAGYGGIHIEQAGVNFNLASATIRNCSGPGIQMNGQASYPVVTNPTIINNGGKAVENARIDAVPNFSNGVISGNGGNYIRVTNGAVATNLSIGPTNCLGGALFMDSPLNIQAGTTLTLAAGTVMKFNSGGYSYLDGTLLALGTAGQPVTFTSFKDDSVAGDTNGDGATGASGGYWYGLIGHTGGAASVLDHATIRYAGYANYGGVHLEQAGCDLKLLNTTIENGSAAGINMNNVLAHPTVTYCAIQNNGGVAIENCRFDVISAFTNDVVTGNGGNFIHVTNGSLAADTTVQASNCIGGALYVSGSLTIPLGYKLSLESGVVLKFSNGGYLGVSGALQLDGSADDPVVFTSISDDTYGGDTNGDGNASAPGPGWWYGVQFNNSGTTTASLLKHALVRYAGYAGYSGLSFEHPLIGAVEVRSEHASASGMRFTSGGAYFDITAFDCNADGLALQSGNALIGRATAAKNGGVGIRAQGSFSGTVSSANAFGNGGGNITGLAAGKLFYSNGSPTLAGSNGNIDVDPQFTDMVNGDLTLKSTSPCIDKGDPSDAPLIAQDDTGVPRFLDGDLNYNRRVDMGAYEFDNVRLKVTGNLTPGGSMTIDVSGKIGMSALLFVGTAQGAVPLAPAGALFLDLSQTWFTLSWGTVPSNLTFPIPGNFPPVPLFLQVLGTPGGGVGNLSNPADATIQ